MSKLLLVFTLLINFSAIAANKNFGGDITLTEMSDLKQVLANYDAVGEKDILVEGEVEKVCQMKGCWLTLKTDNEAMRVIFKDYGFSVPKDIAGKKVKLQGKVVRKGISVKEQKHYLKDEKADKSKINAVRQPKATYRFVASAVELLD